ncbi:hypothetical protein AD428_20800 [Achromobacter sp. DMS1]|uniref:hypothetical protein n=1 Tax=Achromobacter sp. DMS1 TaxID=1688405 RepID=UPI00069F67EB|nr:hypothetical protein [Achromobacter sp. DMS1]KOF52362.1 hypothetical protein AD428_20800 [Achromobacter sp. DMS1]
MVVGAPPDGRRRVYSGDSVCASLRDSSLGSGNATFRAHAEGADARALCDADIDAYEAAA